MSLLERLESLWRANGEPFLIGRDRRLRFADVREHAAADLSAIRAGDVVALIGDFDPGTVLTLLRLLDMGAVVVPLTMATRRQHAGMFEAAHVDAVVCDGTVTRRQHSGTDPLLASLRARGHAGLVLFTSGTTGLPKAILHDFEPFLRRFETPRPTWRTLAFLLFDHIGGLNTLFHTLFNLGQVVVPPARGVDAVLETCRRFAVQVLPTTPTFLRMMLLGGVAPDRVPRCLEVITYGTERMDQATLDALCGLLPHVDFRQTYGLSELGILRVKSVARDSLFMRIGGEGVETRIAGGVLHIRSQSRMLGYLNAPSPFDADGWYDTGDMVEEADGCIRIVGRRTDVINVGGLKFMAADVERVALECPQVLFAKACPRDNPITGQHVELLVQPAVAGQVDGKDLAARLAERLPPHMVPRRIRIGTVAVGHRLKRA